MNACPECAIVAGGPPPLELPPLQRGAFVIHPRPEPGAHAGWMLVAPRRHVEQVAELSDDEARQLGPLLREVAAALRAEPGVEKTYVACFAEVVPHIHFHVVARVAEAPADTRGAAAFQAAPSNPSDEAHRRERASRVLTRLAATPDATTRWRPLLLSALLWPGAGQIVAGRKTFGWVLAGATAATLLLTMSALVVETLLRVPTNVVLFDDFASLVALSRRLALEIRPEMAPYFWTLILLWLTGCLEATYHALGAGRTGR